MIISFIYNSFIWSESHTSYELRSLSRGIIHELLLKFNGNIENL